MVCLLQVGAYFTKSYLEGKQAPEVLTMSQEEANAYLALHPEAVVEEDVSPLPEQPQNAVIPSKETRQEEAPAKDAPAVLTLTADNVRTALCIAIPTVSVVLLLIIIIPLVRLRLRMRKEANGDAHSDGNILHAAWIQTPFSFGRTIFLPMGRTPDEERLFILHEQAHIACRHYVDVWAIELLTRLMWFNPVLWMVRKTLRDLHEFEADRLVLEQGTDAYAYQCLLVSEASEDCTIIANGFNNSFIRRRIKEMKRTERVGISRFGKLLTALWMLALTGGTVAFALPEKTATIVHVMRDTRTMGVDTCYVEGSVALPQVTITRPSFIVHTHGDSTEFTSIVSEAPDSMYSQRLFIKYPARSKEEATEISSRIQNQVQTALKLADVDKLLQDVAQAPTAPSPAPQQEANETPSNAETPHDRSQELDNPYVAPTYAPNGWRYVAELPKHDPNDKRRIKLRHEGDETFLTFAKKIRNENELVRFGGPDSYIVDATTGVHYKARRCIPDYAWHYFYVKDMVGETIEVTVVFPRIPDSTEWIELYQVTRDKQSGEMLKVAQIME
jgi:beta-lactamase regulating signal transducer with metallopeptidase domain